MMNQVNPMSQMMNEEINVAGLPLHFPKPSAGAQLPTLAEWNQRYVEYVLSFTKGKKTAAARILGINRRTLYRRKTGKESELELDPSPSAGQSISPRASHLMDSSTEVPAGHQVQ